jgi:hypothetical protein
VRIPNSQLHADDPNYDQKRRAEIRDGVAQYATCLLISAAGAFALISLIVAFWRNA